MHWDTFKQDNYSTVGGDGGCRVGEVWAGTTSPMPDHKGFKPQQLSEIHPLPLCGSALQGLIKYLYYVWLDYKCAYVNHLSGIGLFKMFSQLFFRQ